GDKKMSKSEGNEIVVTALLQRHRPEALRFLLLNTHYRSPIEYSEKRLEEMQRALDSFHRFFERFQRITGGSFYDLQAPTRLGPFDPGGTHASFLTEVAGLRQAFLDNMNDDFNTGGAVGVLNELLTALNRFADARQLEAGKPDAAAVADFR